MKIKKGFTLVEVLIVLALIVIISLIVIATLNPLEQLNKARDSANDSNAANLLSAIERYQVTHDGEYPDIQTIASSEVCSEIINSGFVYDLVSLDSELPEWFTDEITREGSELYVGFMDRTRVCYQVKSVRSIAQVAKSGCSIDTSFYLCLPK